MSDFLRGGMATEVYADAQAAAAQAAAIAEDVGVGQTWQDVTASRAAGVNYTNTTGKPIEVAIVGTASSTGKSIYCDGVVVGFLSTVAQSGSQFIVPAGSVYSLQAGTISFVWAELRT